MSGILAEYDSVGKAIAGIKQLRAAGHDDLDVFSPIPYEELEVAMGIVSSPVRRWALIGGITGLVTAYALTALTSLAYPLITQGKPIVSLPAYFIIMFELTILFTGFPSTGTASSYLVRPVRRPSRISCVKQVPWPLSKGSRRDEFDAEVRALRTVADCCRHVGLRRPDKARAVV